jgi:hypothetical protein
MKVIYIIVLTVNQTSGHKWLRDIRNRCEERDGGCLIGHAPPWHMNNLAPPSLGLHLKHRICSVLCNI